jgi:hypothetical protein
LELEVTEIVTQDARIGIISGRLLMVVVVSGSGWLSRRLFWFSIQFALNLAH